MVLRSCNYKEKGKSKEVILPTWTWAPGCPQSPEWSILSLPTSAAQPLCPKSFGCECVLLMRCVVMCVEQIRDSSVTILNNERRYKEDRTAGGTQICLNTYCQMHHKHKIITHIPEGDLCRRSGELALPIKLNILVLMLPVLARFNPLSSKSKGRIKKDNKKISKKLWSCKHFLF